THKPAGSTQWSMPVNVTPNGNDCLFPSMANTVDGHMYIAYSADVVPGDRVTNTELPTEETSIYLEVVPTSVLSNTLYQPQAVGFTEQIAIQNLDKSLTSVQEQPETSSIVIRPNPAKDYVAIDFVTNQTGNVSVDIVDQLGNIVLSHTVLDASSQEIMLSLKALSAGMYSARIQQGNQFITKSFVVIK
ncbi:MAG TPA: T9SS type A sorting domain-containing protein, partial [Candidatus Kapabacteria bacterium]|nr:T9SS type A sorting domain-containing protein [Candidatus Kapabacteria bacterium]